MTYGLQQQYQLRVFLLLRHRIPPLQLYWGNHTLGCRTLELKKTPTTHTTVSQAVFKLRNLPQTAP